MVRPYAGDCAVAPVGNEDLIGIILDCIQTGNDAQRRVIVDRHTFHYKGIFAALGGGIVLDNPVCRVLHGLLFKYVLPRRAEFLRKEPPFFKADELIAPGIKIRIKGMSAK